MIDPRAYELEQERQRADIRLASYHAEPGEHVVGAYFEPVSGVYRPVTEEQLVRTGRRIYES